MTTDKILRALELRRAGVAPSRIAEELGFADGRAVLIAIEAEMMSLPSVADQRLLELERLERMQQLLWPKVLKGESGAIALAMQLGAARMRLLSSEAEADNPAATGVVNDLAAFKSKSRSRA